MTSRLTERLREVVGPRTSADLSPRVADALPESGDERPLEETLGGVWRSRESGRYLLVERKTCGDAHHGAIAIGHLAERIARSASETTVLAQAARPPLLFFDLETTGLNGGAGTYAFLVGLGSFDADGSFVTRQYVMTQPGHERPMLLAVAEQLLAGGALVSFNGKSFDAPLLESRFLFHRLSWVGTALPHLDVLHPARRFWRPRVPDARADRASSCSLSMLERHVLGALRHGDVPGMEAPTRYFRFVRSGDAGLLSGVLEHNRLDLLSLAALTGRLLELVSRGAEAATTGREAFALGCLYERAGRITAASGAFDRALELITPDAPLVQGRAVPVRTDAVSAVPAEELDGGGHHLRVEVLRSLAKLARRLGRYDAAAARWRAILDCPVCPVEAAREAAEALAVHHEHRRRDFEAARAFALRTLTTRASAARDAALRHRLTRLERKIGEKPGLLLGE